MTKDIEIHILEQIIKDIRIEPETRKRAQKKLDELMDERLFPDLEKEK